MAPKIYLINMMAVVITLVDLTMERTSMEKTSHSIRCLHKLRIMPIMQRNLVISTNSTKPNCLMTLINGGRATMRRKVKPIMMESPAQTMNLMRTASRSRRYPRGERQR